MFGILHTSKPKTGNITVSKVVTGAPADETYFEVTLTGQGAVPTIVSGYVNQSIPIIFDKLPFDTYFLSEETLAGYGLGSISPESVTLSRANRNGNIVVTNVIPSTIKYGALYNWYAATDIRNITPEGWEIPTRAKWDILIANQGGVNIAGGHLKEDGTTHWLTDNADNSSLFNGKGSGIRTATFLYLKEQCGFWTNEGYTQPDQWGYYYKLNYNNTVINKLATLGYNGLSIRPVKSTTTLTNGQSGIYTGNDGKIYRTICIGTQEWLADNLNETKYRNGDSIAVVTNNVEWTNLLTGAMCYYDNDITNA